MEQRQRGKLHSAMKAHVKTTRKKKKSSIQLNLTVVTPNWMNEALKPVPSG